MGLAVALIVVLGGTSPLPAQLNENCTVSILNRTTRVRADGSWRIENVPATFGGVRARATCVENAITASGSTSVVNVLPDQANAFDAGITLGVPDPIPDFLTVTAPVTTLNNVGDTAQLTVTATFIDKLTGDTSTTDVTASAGGTNYNISNPAIATVSVDGLVTAVTSGTVLISALNGVAHPRRWSHIGSRVVLGIANPLGTSGVTVPQVYPTYNEYSNLIPTNTFDQAPEPIDNFSPAGVLPYPPNESQAPFIP